MNPLHHYQERMVAHIHAHPKCYLAAEVGLGKTRTVLESLLGHEDKTLIVGPLRVVKHVWEAERDKWDYPYRFNRILGTAAQRRTAADTDADIYLINYENLVWLRSRYTPETWPFNTVIFDEASMLKSPGAKRTRAAQWIGKQAEHVVLLSGTPAASGLLDLYAQFKILDGGKRLGRSMDVYKRKYFYPTDFNQYNWVPLPGSEEVIYEQVDDIMVSLSSEDYLTLPDLIVNDVSLDLGDARKGYDELVKTLYLEIEDETISAQTAGVLVNKLTQYTSGSVYDENGAVVHLHDEKMNALTSIIEESAGEPILIVYQYKHTLARIMSRYKDLFLSDDIGIEAWTSGEAKLLAIHNSTSHGLNLQSNGNTIVYVDIPWSAEAYIQMNGRLHRQGQDKPVIVHRLVCEDTIDEDICTALSDKISVQQLLMEAVKQ